MNEPNQLRSRSVRHALVGALALVGLSGCLEFPKEAEVNPATKSQRFPRIAFNTKVGWNSHALFSQGKDIFRFETFGSEFFWGDQLRLHEAIAGEKYGGIGPGLTPRRALELGLKVDS